MVYPIINSLIGTHLAINDDLSVVKEIVSKDLTHRFSPKHIDIADRVPILAAALHIRYHQLTFLDVRQ